MKQPSLKSTGLRLTMKGGMAVDGVRRTYQRLLPEYGKSAVDRLIFERPDVPAAVISFALKRASADDSADMVRQGYAEPAQ